MVLWAVSLKNIVKRRLIVSERFQRLDKLIPQYAANKSELDNYKKVCDKDNAQIKQLMTELALSWYKTEDYKISRIVQKREKLNEDILLDLFIQDTDLKDIAERYNIIKLKEYIDMDALEKAIYNGGLSDGDLLKLNKAKETKEVTTLRLSKIKGDK